MTGRYLIYTPVHSAPDEKRFDAAWRRFAEIFRSLHRDGLDYSVTLNLGDAKPHVLVVVWRFDRFARSIEQLVLALAEFRTLGIDFVSSQEALDTSTPMGKAMFTIIGAMAELERNVIRERVVAGIEHARVHGTKSGSAIGRPRVVFDRAAVVELRAVGQSWRQIAAALSASVRSVRRVGVAKPSSCGTETGSARVRGA
jgi:DNA invertase Pin-like site-specific DNA recombinase